MSAREQRPPTRPDFFVYNRDGQYVGRAIDAEDAACLASLRGDGATVRYQRRIVWREGSEDQPAGESFDFAASVIHERIESRPRPV